MSAAVSERTNSSTPPPTLERQEPTEEKVKEVKKRSKSHKPTLSSVREEKKADGTTRHIISIKTPPSRPSLGASTSTASAPIVRITRHKQQKSDESDTYQSMLLAAAAENNRVARMDPNAPCSSRDATNPVHGMKFRGSIIGVKPPPKGLNGLPKQEIRTTPVVASKKGRYEEPVVKEEEMDEDMKMEAEEEEDDDDYYDGPREKTPERGPGSKDCDQNCSPIRRHPDEIINIIIGETDPELKKRNAKIMAKVRADEEHRERQKQLLVEKLAKEAEQKSGVGHKMARSEEIVVERKKDEGSKCTPMFSTRDDDFYRVMMRGDSEKNGGFLTRSLAEIYNESREFYQSLMKPDTCVEWAIRPRVGPDVDGYVHQTSGATVKVANGAEMTQFQLKDLFNHREFRLGEIVWAKFQREYWPGYIKAFLPSEIFDEYKGDAIMVQWISDDELFSHVCYADVLRFDFYFAIKYQPQKMDKFYVNNVAKAIAMDGRPGFWEEYINKPVYDQMLAIGGNLFSMPQAEKERVLANPKMKAITPAQQKKIFDIIHEKEINHFQHHYKAIYAGRNQIKWSPNQEICNEKLSFTRQVKEKEPVEKREKRRGRPSLKRKKEGSEEGSKFDESEFINPSHSPYPLYAAHITEVNVVEPDGTIVSTHMLFANADKSPLSDTLEEQQPTDLGAHQYMSFNAEETARLAARLEKSKAANAKMIKEEGEEVQPRSETQEDPLFAVAVKYSSAITAHEVLHLTKEKQIIYDKYEVCEDKTWDFNSRVCAHHIRIEFEIKEQRIKEHNERVEEKRRIDCEKKAEAARQKEEKASQRVCRNGPIVVPEEKVQKRRTKKVSEDGTPSGVSAPPARASSGRPPKRSAPK
ncbi:hypothetical protein PFISCL1PPCAC_27389 [Pristionchus fissidentatus]|uniref:Uncharacterized protein n=1 Tax=Pristionchus fissidentatus TaxID=1538716 RepID=A0AAV5WYI1_9BILA|nr:hypothetical protein PFISCL1PPCAC_27389 [Pristionchus fissidentatus]